jgi:hypothetical protein
MWLKLKKRFMPTSTTSLTLHFLSILHAQYDESIEFEDFVASKRENNRLLGELGWVSLLDPYITVAIRAGLPNHLKQVVAHLADNKITTETIIHLICSHRQESQISIMQTASNTALYGRPNKPKHKREFQPCRTPGCPKPETHPTNNCWAPGGLKHDPNRWCGNTKRRGKERAHKVDDDYDEDDDSGTTSMTVRIDRSFVTKQSDSDLLYASPTESPTSSTTSQAYIAKGPPPIIIDSGTTSHIHNEQSDFTFVNEDNTNNITGFGDGSVSSSGRGTAVIWTKSPEHKGSVNRIALRKAMFVPLSNVSLLLVSRFDKAGCRVEFANGQCYISDAKTDEIILTGTMRKNLYYLDNVTPDATAEVLTKVYHTTNSEVTLDLMHRRLSHLNMRAVKQLFKKDMVRGATLSAKHLKATPSICECCVRGKMQRAPFPKSPSRETGISCTQISGDPHRSCRSVENSTLSPLLMTLVAARGSVFSERKAKRSKLLRPGTRKLNAKPVGNSGYSVLIMAASI